MSDVLDPEDRPPVPVDPTLTVTLGEELASVADVDVTIPIAPPIIAPPEMP